jgi:hypothetical protein
LAHIKRTYFQNVPVELINDCFQKSGSDSCDDALYLLTYLKLRKLSSSYGGNLPSIKFISESINLSEKTVKKHLKVLLSNDWIRKTEFNHYQLVSVYNHYLKGNSKRMICVAFDDVDIDKYSYKNLRKFRALLCSILEDNFIKRKNYKKSFEKVKAKKTTWKEVIKTDKRIEYKLKLASSGKRGKLTSLDYNECSLGLSACIVKKAKSTISKYHVELEKGLDKKIMYRKTRDVESYKYMNRNDISILNKNIKFYSGQDFGKFFFIRGYVTFIPITKKVLGFNKFKKVRVKKSKKVTNYIFDKKVEIFEKNHINLRDNIF